MSKKIYPSNYTDKKVTDSQYLVDFIIERIAKKEKRTLPYRYWNLPEWNKVFRRQIGEANKLLKEVDCVTIMNFLRSARGKNIYSLGLKKQIIDGCKIYTKTIIDGVTCDSIVIDDFIEQIPDDEVDLPECKNSSVSLWEKL